VRGVEREREKEEEEVRGVSHPSSFLWIGHFTRHLFKINGTLKKTSYPKIGQFAFSQLVDKDVACVESEHPRKGERDLYLDLGAK